jgi:hypothetical protein
MKAIIEEENDKLSLVLLCYECTVRLSNSMGTKGRTSVVE